MRARQNGGVIGPTNVANSSVASGIYSLVEAQLDKQSNTFPQYVIPAEPQFYLNAMLLHGDGSNGANNNVFLDSSSNAYTVTRNGTPTQGSYSPFNLNGWSNLFNGSTDAFTVAGSSAFAFGTGDFTIEFWMRSTQSATQVNLVWMTGSWAIIAYSNSQLYYQSAQAASNIMNFAYGSLFDGNWHHVALCRASGQARFFIDGVPIGSATADSTNYTATSTVNIANIGGYGWFGGTMSNLRIVKGTAVYGVTNSFTPPTSPLTAISGTSLLTCQSNRFIDNSTNAYTLTAVGAPTVYAYQPFAPTNAYGVSSVGGSIWFNGSTDYLDTTIASTTVSGDFTIEAWVNMSATGGTYTIMDAAATQNNCAVYFYSGTNLRFLLNGTQLINYAMTPLANTWYHVAIVRSGTTITLYLNGASVATATSSTGITLGTSLRVGRLGSSGTGYMNGYISNFRFVNGTAIYTTAFTPPTAPVTAVANTLVLLNGTNSGVYDTTGKNNLFTGTSAGLSTTQSKFGGSSMYFGGTSAYALYAVPSTASLSPIDLPGNFGTSDFTVECWFYITASGGYQALATNRPSAGPAGSWFLGLYNGTTQIAWLNAASATLNSTAVTTGAWHHVAVSRASGVSKLFIDGALTGTSSVADTTAYTASGLVSIGGDIVENTYYFNGYIDDFRISRYARYTAAFTPPTAAFLNQ